MTNMPNTQINESIPQATRTYWEMMSECLSGKIEGTNCNPCGLVARVDLFIDLLGLILRYGLHWR